MVLAPVAPLERAVEIPAAGLRLRGILELPAHPAGLVIFAHGSGSNRFSPRNQRVAIDLRQAGLGTLLFDLLSEAEAAQDAYTARLRFDVPRLAERLEAATDWALAERELRDLPIGCFGASTGAAAALLAAAHRPQAIGAVVARSGRPDLAGEVALAGVRAPTLFVVGAEDPEVLALNQRAIRTMTTLVALDVVPEATHLFTEPGTLDRVARSAADWFRRHLHRAPVRKESPS